jgi:hypothetical protein
MDKVKRYLILVLFLAGLLVNRGQGQELTFREFDQKSLELYNKSEWKALISLCDQALRDSIDYYYLRLRSGIACFETRRYMKAVLQFRQALNFNEKDPVAGEYLYGCYLELNRKSDAIRVFNELPPSAREKLRNTLPKLHQVNIETGPLLSDQMEKFDTLDLDGEDNIYGETDITQDGYYFNAGLAWGFNKGYNIYGGYSLVKLNKDKLVKIGDSLSVDDQYPLYQHQFYLNGNIPLGKGFYILPALNVILNRYETVMPRLAADSINYLFPLESTVNNSFIGYISLTKDFNIVQTSIFGAFSNLNSTEQFQAGFGIFIFPFGNLDFYLSSKLLNHSNDGNSNIIFDQMVGAKLLKPLWAEINVTFGRMENYFENNAFVVYNITDKMKFKGSARLIYTLSPHWTATAEYLYLLRDGEYTTYSLQDEVAVPVIMNKDFKNQIVLFGLKLNL